MSRALDKLDATVQASVKDGSAAKNMTRDQMLDYTISCTSALKTHLQFFNDIGEMASKLNDTFKGANAEIKKFKVVQVWQKLMSNLTGIAKARQEAKFFGAIIEAMQAMVMIGDEVVVNIDKLFVDKTFNLYNTKISHVAIYGVIDNMATMGAFVEYLIAAYMNSRNPDVFKLQPYQTKYLDDHVEDVGDICCRMINGRMGKTFAAAVLRYKSSGNDAAILTSDNQTTSQFAKLGNEVQEADIRNGAKGLHIFRVIGDFIVDFFDKRAQKQRALREQHKARVEFLQMELEGEDPNSERYKKIQKIIKNYQDMIDRLNQKLDKYYNED